MDTAFLPGSNLGRGPVPPAQASASAFRATAASHRPGCFVAIAAVALLRATSALASGDFYEEPLQTLSDYLRLDQLPAKSIGTIRAETARPAAATSEINFTAELLGMAAKPGPEALASLDKMIGTARAQSDNALLNVLHDVRDLFAGPATAAETEAYLEWRIEQADQFGVTLDRGKRAEPPKPVDPDAAPKPPSRELIADIDRHLAKASPALKPHWLYVRGAALYAGHQIGESQAWFLKVTRDFPKSPRAEAALYMAARCQMWRTRSPDYTQGDIKLVAAERPQAKKLLDEYFAKYPHGNFLGDALGWSGAFAFDGRDFGAALHCYMQQLELADHPELAGMAVQMVEKTLSHIASEPTDKAFADVAKYPQAAQALVYLVINTSESDNYNGKIDSIEEVRGWRKKILPQLAAAISAESKLYQTAEWKPRYLAMLAYAASGAGQQDQALKLLDSAGPATGKSDDLLMARGVVLHRDKRPGEAAKALEMLLDKFPDSPLNQGARLRLGLALADDHQGGQAVLALHKLLPVPKAVPDAAAGQDTVEISDESPILYDIDIFQIRALIDVLLNFAPIEELAAAAQSPQLDPVLRLQLTETIAQRLLAREQFADAKQYLTPAQFGLVAASLEKLTVAAREAKDPAAHAAACLRLGDAWAAARGKLLTYPLDTNEYRQEVYVNYSADADVRRVQSAPFIGASGNYKLDLENRDELRHAFNWWLEASDAQPGSPQAAQALWRALKSMPQIADVSLFTVERAATRKWSEVGRKIYDRLRTECADSIEAKRYAVTWDFAAPKKPNPGEDASTAYRDNAGAGLPGDTVLGIEDGDNADYNETQAFAARIASLESEADAADPGKARANAEALRGPVRKEYPGQYNARWVNLIDDLALFLSEPDPGAAVRKRYAELRFRFANKSAVGGGIFADESERNDFDQQLQNDIQAALADPATKPVADYFEFLRLAVIANHFVFVNLNPTAKKAEDDAKDVDTYRTHEYPKLAGETQAFLDKYPRSKKREAALLLHARAVYRSSEQVGLPRMVMWPQAARWEGEKVFRYTQQEPFDAKRVLAALDAYDHTFPQGLYAPDIRNYRAAVAFRLHDWKAVLDLTLAQIAQQANPGLNAEAANRLGDLFAQLADERYRVDILAVIKENARARELLQKYLFVDDDAHPLLYMKTWLREQLAEK